jgi:DNA repair exonuclease SbcCD ATPase subunit
MYIERLLLQRFCQHGEREISFCPGLNVIVGPIGSGKSNILKAIRLIFTNYSGNEGNKDADIQAGADPSLISAVTLTGVHRDQRFFATRKLRPSSREFYWEGSDTKLRAEKAIADELQTRMGVDVNMFDEFVIVPQGEIANIIDMDDAKRTEAMHNLVGLNRYSKLYAWLSDYLSTVVVPVIPENDEEISKQLAKHREAKFQLEASVKTYQEALNSVGDLGKAQQVIQNQALVTSLTSSIATNDTSRKTAQESMNAWQTHMQGIQAKVDLMTVKHDGYKAEETSILASLEAARTWELYDSYAARMSAMENMCVEPPKPADYLAVDAESLKVKQSVLSELSVLQHIKRLVDSGNPSCPTCLRPVEQDMRAGLDKLPVLAQQLAEIERREQLSRQYDLAFSNWQNAKVAADKALPALRESQASLGLTAESVRPAINSATLAVGLATTRKYIESAASSLTLLKTDLENAKASVTAFAAQLQTLETEATTLGQQLAALPGIDDASYQAALLATTQATQLKEAVATRVGELNATNSHIAGLEARLTKAVEAKKEAEAVARWRVDVETSRALFHRDKLPFELAKNGMLALAARMNEVLTAFGAGYRVHAGNGSSFKASFYNQPGKGVQPDNRLSGGERAQYGLALRVAAHSLWAQELGFLAMDEPTYGFGQNDIGCVRVAIEELLRAIS